MKKTEHYQLNQWEPTDKISREDFNADNAAIDAAIQAVADTAAGKAGAAEVTALSQTVNEVAAANCLVKLTELTTTAAASYVDVDLSGFDLSQYRCLEVYMEGVSCSGQNTTLALHINGDESFAYLNSVNSAAPFAYFSCGIMTDAAQGGGQYHMTLGNSGKYLALSGSYVSGYTSSGSSQLISETFFGFYKSGALGDLRFLRLKDINYGYSMDKGMQVAVYGLKR